MLRIFFVLMMLVSLFGGVNLAAGDVFPGTIVIYPDRHEIQFPIGSGVVEGINWPGKTVGIQEVDKVIFNSNRVGWQDNSICQAIMQPDGSCVITGTPNNDLGIWCVKLKSGEFCYCNFDRPHRGMWEISSVIPGAPQPSFVSESYTNWDDFVKYGNYKLSTIIFQASRAFIQFNCNLLCGFMNGRIDPAKVSRVNWNSDKVGWLDKSVASGTLSTDTRGNFLVVVNRMPREDAGNFSFRLNDGTDVWINIDKWEFQAKAVALNHAKGFIEYKSLTGVPLGALNLLLGSE